MDIESTEYWNGEYDYEGYGGMSDQSDSGEYKRVVTVNLDNMSGQFRGKKRV